MTRGAIVPDALSAFLGTRAPSPNRVGRVLRTGPGREGGGRRAPRRGDDGRPPASGLRPPASFGLEYPVLSCFNHVVRAPPALLAWAQFHPLGDLASLCPGLNNGRASPSDNRLVPASPHFRGHLCWNSPGSPYVLTAVEMREGVSQGSQPTNRSGVAGAEQQAWAVETDPLPAPPDPAAWPAAPAQPPS